MTIRAINFNRGRDLAINMAVTMPILREMAIDAVHAEIEVN